MPYSRTYMPPAVDECQRSVTRANERCSEANSTLLLGRFLALSSIEESIIVVYVRLNADIAILRTLCSVRGFVAFPTPNRYFLMPLSLLSYPIHTQHVAV